MAIRTGSADFSHNVLAKRWVSLGYHSKDGVLSRNDEVLELKEERDLFAELGLEYTDPKYRR